MTVGTQYITALESVLALSSMVLAFLTPKAGRGFRRLPLHRALATIAARPRLAIWVVALLPCLARFALLPWMPMPQPAIQEEFSYLLQADTFAHGRLANRTSPMAVFFDNVEIIQSPHYESARPPAQGLFLAFGEVLFHSPWSGVCLSVIVMCAAVYWMLLGWTRPRWALLTALLFGMRFGIFSYWMNSYWGCAATVLGGALVLGAAPRIMSRRAVPPTRFARLMNAFWLVLGCGLLATSRPYEGAVFVFPVIVALLLWWMRSADRQVFIDRSVKIVLPVLLLSIVLLGLLAYFNHATTGQATKFAYQVWGEQQFIVPNFWWEPLRSPIPAYYSPQTKEFNTVWNLAIYNSLHVSHWRTAWLIVFRYLRFLSFHLRPLFLLPLVFWPNPRRSRLLERSNLVPLLCFAVGVVALVFRGVRHQHHSQFVVVAFLILLAACWLRLVQRRMFWLPSAMLFCGVLSAVTTTYWMKNYDPHYSIILFLFVAEGMRRIHVWRRHTGEGAAIVRNLVVSSIAIALALAAFAILRIHVKGEDPFHWSSYENRLQDRADVAAWLARQPSDQLAIVRYGPRHEVIHEWVYNGADLEVDKIVWARELRPDWNSALVQHYQGRKIWLVEPDARPVLVAPYPVWDLPPPAPASALPIPGRSNVPATRTSSFTSGARCTMPDF